MTGVRVLTALGLICAYACSTEGDSARMAAAGGASGSAGAGATAGTAGLDASSGVAGADAAGAAGTDAAPAPCPEAAVTNSPAVPDPGPDVVPAQLDCGTPVLGSGTALRRAPYLQRMEPDRGAVLWTTTGAEAGSLRYGPGPSGPWTMVPSTTEAFPASRTGDTTDYVQHTAALTGLEPGRQYCYEVRSGDTTVASGLRFTAAWTEPARTLRILTFGDSGSGSADQLAVRDLFSGQDFDLLLHLGDIAYGEGTFPQFEERFFGVYADVLHSLPTYPAVGNHEYGTPGAQPYLDVFDLWKVALRERDQERYYSFDYGDVHFVSLDSNDETLLPIRLDFAGTQADDMIDWLEADLRASTKPWKIVFFHHPPFTSSGRGENVSVTGAILPALERGGVDLVLVGHDHHYERLYPLRGDCALPGGERAIPYVIAGMGGAGTREARDRTPYSAVVEELVYGFLELSITGCRARGTFHAVDRGVLDTFEIDGCAP